MGLSAILLWILDKAGGAAVGEKAKTLLPWLNKAKKDVKQARHETAEAQKNLGKAERDIDLLIAEIEYQRAVIIYLAGCRDTLENYCRVNGINLPRDFPPSKPVRQNTVQMVKNKRTR